MGNKIQEMLNQVQEPVRLKGNLMEIKGANRQKTRALRSAWVGMNQWARVAAVVAVVVALGTGTTFAAKHFFGLKAFVPNIPEEAEPYINYEVEGLTQTITNEMGDVVDFAVKEMISDTDSCHIILEATLKDTENYILVVEQDAIRSELKAKEYYSDANEGETIAEYAMRNHKEMLLVESSLAKEFTGYGVIQGGRQTDATRAELYIGITNQGGLSEEFEDGKTLSLENIVCKPSKKNATWNICRDEKVSITLQNVAVNQEKREYAFESEMPIGESGMFLRKVVLTNTALETKVHFEIVSTDKEIDSFLGIHLVDEEGNIYKGGSGITDVPDKDGVIHSRSSYQKMEFPDQVNVRVRNLYTDEVYELKNVPVVEMK